MSQVATLVERSRYSRTFNDGDAAGQLPTITEEIRRGIAAPQPRHRQLLAFLLPRSIFAAGAGIRRSEAFPARSEAGFVPPPRQRSSILSMKP